MPMPMLHNANVEASKDATTPTVASKERKWREGGRRGRGTPQGGVWGIVFLGGSLSFSCQEAEFP